MTTAELRKRIVGADTLTPIHDGSHVPYLNLDNAASTPALVSAREETNHMLDWYASIHRGAGYKSQLASAWYELARKQTMQFVGADSDYHCVVLTHNTTDAINRLAAKFPFDNDKSVVISHAEHHANDLPWRNRGQVARVPVSSAGEIDPDDLDRTLDKEAGRARLVSVTGASNVTGTVQPIHELARVAHKYGIPIAIDAAQLAPHLPIRMAGSGEDDRIDFLMLSAHKMYAPMGGGALIGSHEFFANTEPSVRGGGAVKAVEPDAVFWADPPDRDEAGSPNVVGMVSMAAAMRELQEIGWDVLEEAERRLSKRFVDGLLQIDDAKLYGLGSDQLERRLGVIAFNLGDIPHALVAAALAYEHGIGVRNGCFCAHPFVLSMMEVGEAEARAFSERVRNGSKSLIPGAVRASFGLYTSEEDVDRALSALDQIARGNLALRYEEEISHGEFHPIGGAVDYDTILMNRSHL